MNGLSDLSIRFLDACKRHGILAAMAESCTGGGIVAALTDIPGSSSVVDRGFVTYSNTAKQEMLGVSADTLERYGAVSEQTAREMAEGALEHSRSGIALSVTGVAGPDGGTPEKPVGLVWIGLAQTGKPVIAKRHQFTNLGRAFIRGETIRAALLMGLDALDDQAG